METNTLKLGLLWKGHAYYSKGNNDYSQNNRDSVFECV